MSTKNEEGNCSYCRYFIAYDGVGELWTDCNLHGCFEGSKDNCEDWKPRVTMDGLRRKVRRQEVVIEKQRKVIKEQLVRIVCQDEEIQRLLQQLEEV